MPKLLLVEDEAIIRDAFKLILLSQNYDLDVAHNGQEALEKCQNTVYDIILLDLMMPKLDGVGFLKAANLKQTAPQTRVVILSNLSSGTTVNEAVSLGAARHEVKSNLAPNDLIAIVESELDSLKLHVAKP